MSDALAVSDIGVAMSHLYLLVFPERKLLKIGKADDIEQRVKTLRQVWGGVDYSQSYELNAPRDTVFRVEKALHLMMFSQQRLFDEGDGKTEMFDLSALDTVIDYVNLFTKHGGGVLQKGISHVKPISCHRKLKKPPRMHKVFLRHGINSDLRGLPTALVLSSLFGVDQVRKGKREVFVDAPITCCGTNLMSITGEGLRQDDADVLLQLLSKEGDAITPTIYSTLKALKWSIHPDSYERLRACVKRLQETFVSITLEGDFGTSIPLAGNLLNSEFKFRCVGNGGVQARLGAGMGCLFNREYCVNTEWYFRLSLTSLGKFLYTLFSAGSEHQTYSVETLHKLTGSKIKELRKFKYELKAALALLVEKEFFLSAKVDDKSGLVTVERKADRKALE